MRRTVSGALLALVSLATPLALVSLATPAGAHFSMLFPAPASGKKGEAVVLTYQFGHPFEHQLSDAPAPLSLTVVGPDDKKSDLTADLERTEVASGDGKVSAYRLRYTPEARGDYAFVLRTPPLWREEEKDFVQDTVKVVLHVQAQKGWDAMAEGEWEPLTRPYGLQPGVAFQARMRSLPGAIVEIERYNATPPRELPADEQITRTAKTDAGGVVTATLFEPGWWCLGVTAKKGTKERDGKEYTLRQRSILWVYVDEKAAGK